MHVHHITFIFLAFRGEALSVGMFDYLFNVGRINSIQNVEEELAVWIFLVGVFVLEIDHDLWIILESRKDVFDGKLIVPRHIDVSHRVHWQELLLYFQHFLEKIFVHGTGSGTVQLLHK